MGPNKAVHLMFLGGGVILYFLTSWTADWIWGYFIKHPPELIISAGSAAFAITVGVLAYRNERLYTLASEVAAEIKKVNWPTRAETQAATMIVVVTVILASVILGLFDAAWSWVTDQIYG